MYLVTGGAGFIGSNLVRALVKRGAAVRVLDDLSTGRLANLDPFKGRIESIQGDIRDLATCRKALQDVRVVLHQAAIPSVPRSVSDPVTSCAVNIQGTLNMLIAARDAGVARLVFASSSSVYGDTPTLPKVETMTPTPQSPYAVTKLTGEQLCAVFARTYGLATIALRYFNVYGPGQNPASEYAAAIPKFMACCRANEPAVIYGDGQQTRDFTFVEDCVQANLLAAEAPIAGGEVCNIGSGTRVTIAEVYETIRRLSGGGQPPRFAPARAGDVRHSLADISAAGKLLGYRPAATLERGLAATLERFS